MTILARLTSPMSHMITACYLKINSCALGCNAALESSSLYLLAASYLQANIPTPNLNIEHRIPNTSRSSSATGREHRNFGHAITWNLPGGCFCLVSVSLHTQVRFCNSCLAFISPHSAIIHFTRLSLFLHYHF